MNIITFEIFIIVLLVLANGILALSEIAIVTAKKARLQQLAEAGDGGAAVALELATNPTRFFSTTQVGITLIGVLSGAFGGATLAETLSASLPDIPWLAPYRDAVSLSIVVILITYLSIVFGELVPKRIAQNNAERIASRVAGFMQRFARLFSPIVSFLSASTDLVLRLIGAYEPHSPGVTEEEVKLMLEEGAETGVFNDVEYAILRRVLRLTDRRVSTIMTHRRDTIWLDLEDAPESLHREVVSSHQSYLPAGMGSMDEIRGILDVRKYLSRYLDDPGVSISQLLDEPFYVPESTTTLELLEKFRHTGNRIALVVDEFGGITGIITTTDVLESIVGNLPGSGETIEPEAVQREDGSWLLDGSIPIDEVKELLELRELPEEEEGEFETLGGLMMVQLGRIPSSGDYFEWNGFRFEVVDMDGYRVDKVWVMKVDVDEIN
jgi:putative hemolysin